MPELEAQVAQLEAELDKKVNQSAVVQNMKKMIQDKNTLIAELRQ